MVLSLVTLAATVPLIATSTLQLQDTAQKQQDEIGSDIKTIKCHLLVRATTRMNEERREVLKDRLVTLRNGKLYLDPRSSLSGHLFSGYFLAYPDKGFDGVVTTVNEENMLNWIYVDSTTHEVRYGVRADAERHTTGPMDLLILPDGEKRLTCLGWEGFMAVEEEDGQWAIYFDQEDNGLRQKVKGKRISEIELIREVIAEADSEATAQST